MLSLLKRHREALAAAKAAVRAAEAAMSEAGPGAAADGAALLALALHNGAVQVGSRRCRCTTSAGR